MGLKVCQLCAVDFTLKYFLLPLIDGMKNVDWEVTVVCSDGPYIAELRSRGYEIETVEIKRSFNLFSHFHSTLALIRLFRLRRFDVVHVHTPVAALVGRIAAHIAGIPVIVYTAHGFYFHDGMPGWKRRIFVWLEKIGATFTHLLFTQSEEDARAAQDEHLGPPGRILAIGNGVDPLRFNPEKLGDGGTARLSIGIPRKAFVVGLIGRQVREKGVSEFLSAMASLANAYPNMWVLLIGDRLASDHADGVEAEFVAARELLGDRLVTTGMRDDIPHLLAAMDVFCLPSWREGMPRTIIEAMMMGKPVVATNIRGSREEVVHEETGLLVPVRSPVQLANAIKRFLDDPEWGKRLGLAGRERALRLYDERKIVDFQIDRIEEVLRSIGKERSLSS